MCYNCGCYNPQDDMGHKDNITDQSLEHLATHLGASVEETKMTVFQDLAGKTNHPAEDQHIEEMFVKAAKAWGQPVAEAKKNTFELLKTQMKV